MSAFPRLAEAADRKAIEEKSVHSGHYVVFTPGRVINKSERTCKAFHFDELNSSVHSVYWKDMERPYAEEIRVSPYRHQEPAQKHIAHRHTVF